IPLFGTPDGDAALWDQYRGVHAPLARQLPGLRDLELLRGTADAFGGDPPYYRGATMSFPDEATFKAAMRSEENKRLGKDLMSFAKGKVRVVISQVEPG